jgi:heme-degrading monooxygenase HmoA
MAHALAKVQVTDLDRFKETFTTRGAEKRREHGSRGARVFRNAANPNEVVVLFEWDQSGVEGFMSDPEIPEVFQAGGLQGPPEYVFLEELFEHEV